MISSRSGALYMASTVWRGQLTFGLVSFPVRLYVAARKKRVPLHYVRRAPSKVAAVEPEPEAEPYEHPAFRASPRSAPIAQQEEAESEARQSIHFPAGPSGEEPAPPSVTRVRQEWTNGTDEAPVQRQELLKGYEIAPERYVTFTNEELRAMRPANSPDMQILRSVRLADIDPVYFETSYYVVAERGGERPYALLFAALQHSGYVALAKVTMHGREHVVVVRPAQNTLLAHTMYFTDEIRSENAFQPATEVAKRELELAEHFVEAIAGPFAPEEFKDSHRERLEQAIASKLERNAVSGTAPAATPAARGTVVNILEALQKSLELARKPAKTEVATAKRAPVKAAQAKVKPQRRKA